MAIARLSMKVGQAGKASPHAAYIAREGKYADRLELGEKLEATAAGNMPAWAQHNAQEFWRAADAHERVNGTTYREMEIALPRELSAEQRADLVRNFVRQEIGDQHAYQWAIHTPLAADDKEQPHVHLMFSERQRDGVERDPEQYFKRYNAKVPEKGGARKGYGPHAGETLTAAARAADLKALRMRWQDMTNQHLERAGVDVRIDMRSHAERKTGLEPEAKQLPSQWRGAGRENVIEFRAARVAVASASAVLRREVPDAGAEVINLEAERERRRQRSDSFFAETIERLRAEISPAVLAAAKESRQQLIEDKERREREQQVVAEQRLTQLRLDHEQQRIERMSLVELRAEIERQRPAPVGQLVTADAAVIEAAQRHEALVDEAKQAGTIERRAVREAQQWREAHTVQAKLHDAGLKQAAYLVERAEIVEKASERWLVVAPKIERAREALQQEHYSAEIRITQAQKPALERVSALELRATDLELRAAEQARVENEKRVQAQRAKQAEGSARLLMRELRGMAAKMDMGRTIKALSDPAAKDVRKLVEGLAAMPVGEQRDMLAELLVARFAKNGGGRLRLAEQVDLVKNGPRHDQDFDNDHGISF